MSVAWKAADVKRALKAAKAVDGTRYAVDFPPHGGFRLLPVEPARALAAIEDDAANEWDQAYGVK